MHPNGLGTDPRSMVPESIVQWREQATSGDQVLTDSGFTAGPNFSDRTSTTNLTFGYGPKHTRGFSSPAEIGMLNTAGWDVWDGAVEPWHISGSHEAIIYEDAWRLDFTSLNPFGDSEVGSPLSTEVNFRFNQGSGEATDWDDVSNDSEEMNLLHAGISNLISTTSDMFTVHMRIRTFKRNPINGTWDATDMDYIVDDSRYVMLVDRSNVNSPSDKPKILYFEKLPN
jgi:hypothetical protein